MSIFHSLPTHTDKNAIYFPFCLGLLGVSWENRATSVKVVVCLVGMSFCITY